MKKVLIVNKFLYPNGGSETYIFELGKQLQKEGYEVQYFGMQDERNIVGNHAESYTGNMDFHTGKLSRLIYPFKIIYSTEARRAIRKVLDDFGPDVVHLNNFNFQITPSVIYEVKKYEKQSGHKVKIIFTAHDYQLICPNHMLRCPATEENCEKCIDGAYINCMKGNCIHNSKVKSILGMAEGYFYKCFKAYRYIDTVICPSRFIQEKLEHNPLLRGKTVLMYNFITAADSVDGSEESKKEDYVVYFGRYSREKGIETLLKACERLPHIKFVFAGKGPLEEQVNCIKNIENKGFLTGSELKDVIKRARFSIYPSQWYENCPFSVMESIQYGTPVLGADIGGIPELIDENVTGELFESGNGEELTQKIEKLWNDTELTGKYSRNCLGKKFMTVEGYAEKMKEILA
ncbi:MAG: glycosyltransferase family 4 protein [Lachnospiraceae bacterium]|nr:glycosyltransferase family 4 protein [Lachnospiraceae bacterium]